MRSGLRESLLARASCVTARIGGGGVLAVWGSGGSEGRSVARVGWLVLLVAIVLGVCGCGESGGGDHPRIAIGSKKFTESVILGEMLTQLAESAGAKVRHRRDLGGSRVLFNALSRGDLDAYPEYTGTLKRELLASLELESDAELAAALEEMGLRMSAPIGMNNTYALGVRQETAGRLELATIGDLTAHRDLRMAFSNEFMERADGWPGLRDAYRLAHQRVQGIDHDLAYRALAIGDVDVIDLYATDAEIAYYDLVVLEDDRGYFPRYDAVVLYRADLAERAPEALAAMLRLEGAIDDRQMVEMNELAKIGVETAGGRDQVPAGIVAERFIGERFGLETEARVEGVGARLWRTTVEQLVLVGASMGAAILVAVPLGVVAARSRALAGPVLAVVGVFQTIPALAMLVLLIPLFGLSPLTAIVALFLYSLLPIVRNTHAGLTGIGADLRESADAIALGRWRRLRAIDLPLALPTILAGVKTAAVINVGTATLAALIGAGGYGQPILTGIRLDDFGLILQGAGPAAAMALGAQVLFDGLERVVVPRGLRL